MTAVSKPGFGQLNMQIGSRLGTIGNLVIFAWMIGMMMVLQGVHLIWAAGLCLLAAGLCFPLSFRRLFRLRWLVMILLLAIPPVFLLGEMDRSLAGIPYSSEGLQNGMQIAVRIIVVLIAVSGVTAALDISALAGLFERIGFHGLGFSVGVALNLLPSLQQSASNAWRSLYMRGGLRKKRWRGISLLVMTVISNALGRAEEIALAAEARAFSPEKARSLPISHGALDWPVVILCAGSLVILSLL